MKKFVVENSFWNLFPDAKIGVIVAKHIDNRDIGINSSEQKFRDILKKGKTKGLAYLTNSDFAQNEVIKVWRDAYKSFGANDSVHSSVEDLLSRAKHGENFNVVNPLIDLYTADSLSYALPINAEDLDKIKGDIVLTAAKGNEKFSTYGKSGSPSVGEIIYKDDNSVLVRYLNSSESYAVSVGMQTKNAILFIESLDKSRDSDLNDAIDELTMSIKENLGGTIETFIVTKNKPSIDIEK